MAIRFQCSSCSQPIEIDDVWSSKLVACPYCQNTVTAPETSTLADLSAMPTAKPIAEELFDGESVPIRPSRLGIVSIALAGVAIVLVISYVSICAAHLDQLREFADKVTELRKSGSNPFSASQSALAEVFQIGPGGAPPMWMFTAGFLMIGAGMSWLSAAICALIATRNPTSRKHAYIALGMCALTMLLAFFPG